MNQASVVMEERNDFSDYLIAGYLYHRIGGWRLRHDRDRAESY
jgi:hypothetical protein